MPKETRRFPEGGKKLINELSSKRIVSNPNKSKLTFHYSGNMANQAPHMNWKYTESNDPKYKIYPVEKSFLKLYLNKDGQCDIFSMI